MQNEAVNSQTQLAQVYWKSKFSIIAFSINVMIKLRRSLALIVRKMKINEKAWLIHFCTFAIWQQVGGALYEYVQYRNRMRSFTLLSETATYSLVCELKTAEQTRDWPCLTVQLPRGFWSDTCQDHKRQQQLISTFSPRLCYQWYHRFPLPTASLLNVKQVAQQREKKKKGQEDGRRKLILKCAALYQLINDLPSRSNY